VYAAQTKRTTRGSQNTANERVPCSEKNDLWKPKYSKRKSALFRKERLASRFIEPKPVSPNEVSPEENANQ
jgi:hypothetical protein